MASLLHVGLGNAAAATALALAAALLCRLLLRGRRPAVAHALWLLVLLKLLTPPLWTLPVPWFSAPPREAMPPEIPRPPVHLSSPTFAFNASIISDEVATDRTDESSAPADPPAVTEPGASRVAESDWPHRLGWRQAAGASWAAGSLACFALVIVRSLRFRRLLRLAGDAPPDVKRRVADVSTRLGVVRPPETWLVPGAVCPMLWAVLRRPRLLLPAALWADLTEAQRDTLIAHELAHLRRRDHWVRLVEVAATVLYWWHPAVWWARRELREAEEQCCDAWVVWSLPRSARPYMNAILKAVDFVSDAAGSHPGWPRAAVPPVASGMASGQFRHLERRLSMIRQNENYGVTPAGRTLGRVGLLAVCAGATGLLPLAPSLAQVELQPRSITVVTAPRAENETVSGGELNVLSVPDGSVIEATSPENTVVVQAAPEGGVRIGSKAVRILSEVPESTNGASVRRRGPQDRHGKHYCRQRRKPFHSALLIAPRPDRLACGFISGPGCSLCRACHSSSHRRRSGCRAGSCDSRPPR